MFRKALGKLKVVDDESVFKCPICEDRQYVPRPTESKPDAWGPCDCLIADIQKRKFEKLVSEANIADLRHMTFEKFLPRNAKQKQAFEIVMARHGSYYLFGPWGTGKTHLMAASIFREIRGGIPSVLISVPRLLDIIRKQGRDKDTDIEGLAIAIPYLCLDDIGKQKDSDWTEERLFMLIDERSRKQYSGQCFTSFTSQFSPEMLAKRMDGAIVDRIKGMCEILFVDGESMRRG